MTLSKWRRTRVNPKVKAARRPRTSTYRPQVEYLEPRLAPANHVWTGAAGDHAWSNAGNWTGGTPGAGDVAVFDTSNGGTNIDASIDPGFAGSVQGIDIENYTGTITDGLGSLFIGTNGVTQKSGSFSLGANTLFVKGDWTRLGGTFDAGTSTVNFNGLVQSLDSGGSSFFNINHRFGTLQLAGSGLTVTGTLGESGFFDDGGNPVTAAQVNLGGGIMRGSADMTMSGLFTWSGGTIEEAGDGATFEGTRHIFADGGVTLNDSGGPGSLVGPVALENAGAASWNVAGNRYLVMQDGAVWHNTVSGTLDLQSDGIVSTLGSSGGDQFINDGTVTKSGGQGAASFETSFVNSGTVGLQSGSLTLSGQLTWTGGTISGGQVAANGGVTLNDSTGTPVLDNAALDNAGAATWKVTGSDYLVIQNGAVWHNTAAGSVDLQSDGALEEQGVFNAFRNDGTVTKSGTGGGGGRQASFIDVIFDNSGSLAIHSGTLHLRGDGNGGPNSSYRVDTGATLLFDGDFSQQTLQAGSSLSGSGSVHFSGSSFGRVFDDGTYDVTGDTVVDGDVFFNGPLVNIGGTLDITRNDFTGFGGTLAGTATVIVSGLFTWNSGGAVEEVHLEANGGVALSDAFGGPPQLLFGATLDNSGMATWNASGSTYLSVVFGSVWHNTATGTVDLQTDGILDAPSNSSDNEFINDGLVIKTGAGGGGGVGLSQFNPLFTNGRSATISVRTGMLSLDGGLTNLESDILTGGTYEVFNGGSLRLPFGAIEDNDATILLDGSGSGIITPFGNALAFFDTNDPDSSFTIRNGANVTTGGAFHNAGNLTVGSGSFFSTAGSYTQGSGTTTLAGLLATSAGVEIEGGALDGPGLVFGNLVNDAGTVSPGTGIGLLTVFGDYTQDASGVLNIEIGGTDFGTQYDRLSVTGKADLGGTLRLDTINGFHPADTDTFEILTAPSRGGQFRSVLNDSLGNGRSYKANYLATGVTLTITSTDPEGNNLSVAGTAGSDRVLSPFIPNADVPPDTPLSAPFANLARVFTFAVSRRGKKFLRVFILNNTGEAILGRLVLFGFSPKGVPGGLSFNGAAALDIFLPPRGVSGPLTLPFVNNFVPLLVAGL
jgi:hypothetical protein